MDDSFRDMPAADPKDTAQDLDQVLVAAIANDNVRVEPLPATTTKLMGVVNRGDFALREVSGIVASDQALTAYLLRQASSAGRAGRDIDSIDDAVAVLGAREVMSMAVALGMGSQMCGGGPLQVLKLEVWRRATFCASFCRTLARKFNVAPDQAFLVGLLANFGRSVALSCLEDALPKGALPTHSREFWLDVARRHERDLGLVMAAKWDMPDFVLEAQSALRDSSGLPDNLLARLVVIGDRVSELVDTTTEVSDETLATVPGLEDPQQRAAVLQALHTFGGQMWSLNPAEPKLPENSAVAVNEKVPLVSAVRKIEQGGPAKIRDEGKATLVELKATVHRGKGDAEFRCIAMTHEGLVMRGKVEMAANWVVRMTLHSDPEVTFCGTVVHCQGNGTEHHVGVRRMSLSAEDLLRWRRLVTGPGEAEAAPASVRAQPPANDQLPKKAAAKPRAPRSEKSTRAAKAMAGTSVHGRARKKSFLRRLFSR